MWQCNNTLTNKDTQNFFLEYLSIKTLLLTFCKRYLQIQQPTSSKRRRRVNAINQLRRRTLRRLNKRHTHNTHDVHKKLIRTPPHLIQRILHFGIHIHHVFMCIIDPTLCILQHGILSLHLLPLPQCQFMQVLYPLAYFIELGIELGISVPNLL